MGAAGSIPADEAPAKEAGKTDDEIAIYKFCTGLADSSAKEQCAEGCEMGPPGAPPLPMDAMLGICAKMTVAFPDWKSLCLGITKNDDGTYSVLTQQIIGAMKADLPAIEGTPFPEVKLEELPDEAKIEMTLPVEVGKYTMEGGKVKQGLYVGEIKEDGVEGAAASTPALLELIKGGDLGFACFFKFMGKPLPAPPAFDDMDADGDGELTAEEIFEALSKNNPDVTLERVQEIVAKADADGNGSVSKQEWEEATAKDPGLVPAAWLAKE